MFRGPYTVRQAGYAQSARYTALFLKKLMIMMMMVMRGIIHSFIRRIAIRHCNGARSKPHNHTLTHSVTTPSKEIGGKRTRRDLPKHATGHHIGPASRARVLHPPWCEPNGEPHGSGPVRPPSRSRACMPNRTVSVFRWPWLP